MGKPRVGKGALVLGVPRGGVVVASALARELELPLDVYVSMRLPCPARPMEAFGAVTEEGGGRFDEDVVARRGVTREERLRQLERRRKQAQWAARLYRGGRPSPLFEGRPLIVVDDGVGSGLTLLAAVDALRRHRPRRLIAAVPAGPIRVLLEIQKRVDALFALACPISLDRIASAYRRFPRVSHGEVLRRLGSGHAPRVWRDRERLLSLEASRKSR